MPAPYTPPWSRLAYAFEGVSSAESEGNQTGIVNNTAYGSGLPSGTAYAAPGAGDSPEYSVGLFQVNIGPGANYNTVANALGQQQVKGDPTAAQAYSLGQQFASEPGVQAAVAVELWLSSQFSPWTDSYVDNYSYDNKTGASALLLAAQQGQVAGTLPIDGSAVQKLLKGKTIPKADPTSRTDVTGTTGTAPQQPPTPASTGAGPIMGNCSGSYHYINEGGIAGAGSLHILTPCNVKAILSFLLIASGSLLGLAGVVLLFDRSGKLLGKAGGKAAELAGAGIGLVPGGELVGSTVMQAGHRVSKAAGSKAPAKQTPRQKSTATKQAASQSSAPASQPSSSAPAPRPRQHSSSSSAARPRQHSSSSSTPASRPRQTSAPSQSDVNSMSTAQKRSLVQQYAKSGGAVSAGG